MDGHLGRLKWPGATATKRACLSTRLDSSRSQSPASHVANAPYSPDGIDAGYRSQAALLLTHTSKNLRFVDAKIHLSHGLGSQLDIDFDPPTPIGDHCTENV